MILKNTIYLLFLSLLGISCQNKTSDHEFVAFFGADSLDIPILMEQLMKTVSNLKNVPAS